MFLLSPEADMRPGNLQAQVPRKNAFWFADRDARGRLTKGFLANGGRSVLRLRRTSRTRTIAESQKKWRVLTRRQSVDSFRLVPLPRRESLHTVGTRFALPRSPFLASGRHLSGNPSNQA